MYCPFAKQKIQKLLIQEYLQMALKSEEEENAMFGNARFTTFEVADLALPKIIKNDGKTRV